MQSLQMKSLLLRATSPQPLVVASCSDELLCLLDSCFPWHWSFLASIAAVSSAQQLPVAFTDLMPISKQLISLKRDLIMLNSTTSKKERREHTFTFYVSNFATGTLAQGQKCALAHSYERLSCPILHRYVLQLFICLGLPQH